MLPMTTQSRRHTPAARARGPLPPQVPSLTSPLLAVGPNHWNLPKGVKGPNRPAGKVPPHPSLMHGPAKMHTALARDEKGKGQVGKGVVDVGGLGFGWGPAVGP